MAAVLKTRQAVASKVSMESTKRRFISVGLAKIDGVERVIIVGVNF